MPCGSCFPRIDATLSLRGDVPAGTYALAGPVTARRLRVEGAGEVNGRRQESSPSSAPACLGALRANLAGVLGKVSNDNHCRFRGRADSFQRCARHRGRKRRSLLRDVAITKRAA